MSVRACVCCMRTCVNVACACKRTLYIYITFIECAVCHVTENICSKVKLRVR